jgi:integrase
MPPGSASLGHVGCGTSRCGSQQASLDSGQGGQKTPEALTGSRSKISATPVGNTARALVLMAVLTGMRIGELLALRWKNVDFEGKTIRVREAVYEGHNSTPQTQGGNRDIPFGPSLEQALRHHLGRCGTSENSLVFPSRNGTYLRPGNLQRCWLFPGCTKAERRRFSWHDFRRTHATLMSDMGEPLKTAQAQLGHASLSTTAEIYAQVVPASQRAAVERLEKAVGFLVDPNGPKIERVVHPGSSLIQ